MQSFLNIITPQTYTFFTTLTPRLHGRSKRFFRRPQKLKVPRISLQLPTQISNFFLYIKLPQDINTYQEQLINYYSVLVPRFSQPCSWDIMRRQWTIGHRHFEVRVEAPLHSSTFKDEATILSRNVRILLSWDALLHPRRNESTVFRLI